MFCQAKPKPRRSSRYKNLGNREVCDREGATLPAADLLFGDDRFLARTPKDQYNGKVEEAGGVLAAGQTP
jgi:hypothetical protein